MNLDVEEDSCREIEDWLDHLNSHQVVRSSPKHYRCEKEKVEPLVNLEWLVVVARPQDHWEGYSKHGQA